MRRYGARIWRIAFALFLLRAVVPVGYMPAPLSEGGPFVLCHGASAPTLRLIEAHAGMHHAMHDGAKHDGATHADPSGSPGDGHDERWDHCPLGVGGSDLALAPQGLSLPAPDALIDLARVEPTLAASRARTDLYLARAPPV